MALGKKILLTEPLWPREKQWGAFTDGTGKNCFSHGLATIASALVKAGYQVSTCDPVLENFDDALFIEYLQRGNYDLIGISCYTPSANYVFNTVRLCKKALPKSRIVLGGIHASALPKLTFQECPELDFIVIGEGEYTIVELADNLETDKSYQVKGIAFKKDGKVIVNEPMPLVKDINVLPLPCYSLFKNYTYDVAPHFVKRSPTVTLLASRGCPFLCAFCSSTLIGGRKVRYYSVNNVIEQMDYLSGNLGARGFIFYDSTFTVNKEWVLEFCERLVSKGKKYWWAANSRVDTIDEEMMVKMRKAGCWCLNYGVESANQKSLDLLEKGTSVEQNRSTVQKALSHGFKVMTTYIVGLPGEDKKDVYNTLNFAGSLRTQIAFFFLPVPYPKTKLFNICLETGGISSNISWDDFTTTNYEHMVYVNPNFKKEELLSIIAGAYKYYYWRPSIFYRNLITIQTLDQVKAHLNILKVLRQFVFKRNAYKARGVEQSCRVPLRCDLHELKL